MKFPGTEKFVPAFNHTVFAFWLLAFSATAHADAEADYQRGRDAYRVNDVVGAMEPLKNAADAGHAAAQALYGSILDSSELDDEAARYLEKSAAQDDVEGLYGLAKMYYTGEAKAPGAGEAGRLMRAAAAKGHQAAIITMALAYVRADARLDATNADAPEAAEFLTKAAEFGNAQAIEALIGAYRNGGFGFTADPAKADHWAKRLATIVGTPKKGVRK